MKPHRLYNAEGEGGGAPGPRHPATPSYHPYEHIILYTLMGGEGRFLIRVHVFMGPELRNAFRSFVVKLLRFYF